MLTAIVALPVALALVVLVALTIALTRRYSSRSRLRLDWYLPFFRRQKKADSVAPPTSPIGSVVQSWVPDSWSSDRQSGRRGTIRKWLKRMGPSIASSPVRRLFQAVCLVLFLALFLYVCWPYGSRPIGPGRISSGWQVESVDQDEGVVRLSRAGGRSEWPARTGLDIHLVDAGAESPSDALAGALHIVKIDERGIALKSVGDQQLRPLEALLTSVGPWKLYEFQPGKWPSHYADDFAAREVIPADLFLAIDPLVSISTAIAARSWVWSLSSAAVILAICLVIPRGFCGYVCPLGTVIDLFDWAVSGRTRRLRVADNGWWVHVKYYLLTATLVAAFCGVLISGFVAAIPVLTRAALFLLEPIQTGTLRGWHLTVAFGPGQVVSVLLFIVVLGLGFLRPRFWCKYVCPTGAVFSLANVFRATERKVEASCIHCNQCVEICPFDAIKPDFTTRGTDCTLCQTCAGVCPTYSIKFVERWNDRELKATDDPRTGERSIGRRGFLSWATGTTTAVAGGTLLGWASSARGRGNSGTRPPAPVRPPASVPERAFLQLCIRCGECFKVCPNNVLQPQGIHEGWNGLWTPQVIADWAGCESSCNACGQVCPTGAIRAIPLSEKRHVRMGLAEVNGETCLPFAGREDCDLCVQECQAAGYDAIEYTQVHTELTDEGLPIADSGRLAPVVLADKCVGCGLCQTRCYGVNVRQKNLLQSSAIVIRAGGKTEDRLMHGSYADLHRRRTKSVSDAPRSEPTPSDLPDRPNLPADPDPFGID